ncbi:hypothetical protein P691DRAFT_818096 [Macrolepiota fuliginosa MF-IS2]|uniref:Uncharacterized protein n=1 Tax=Macrolepiota fuliginosa MF-IS2 TaxID=1400762 RepID=A0A9P5XBS1_9AGAR|nr:hypothetical protein P691DRAFT_818096 [Macrolepiota fuliginosa MF-IS2]
MPSSSSIVLQTTGYQTPCSLIHHFKDLIGKEGTPKRILLITTMWDKVNYQTRFG